MESEPEKKWKPANAQTLLWCCFCDARFENPASLSTHLDRYNVNWKLYWQLFYSRRDGKTCNLCNVLHADRRSLECHFKMVHCIIGPCAKPKPEVITIEAGPPEECPPNTSFENSTVGNACSDQLYPTQPGSEQENLIPQVVRPDSIDDIDVLFEINHADVAECETSNGTTQESLHLVPPSSETEQSPMQVLPSHVEELTHKAPPVQSPKQAPPSKGDEGVEIVVPDGGESAGMAMASSDFAVLLPDDVVEELESDGLDLLASSKSVCEVTNPISLMDSKMDGSISQMDSKTLESPEVIKIEDDDAVIPVESSRLTGTLASSVDLPLTASFPAESRHVRPTAVVNPFGAHGERHTPPTEVCGQNMPEMPQSTFLPIPVSPQATTDQRPDQNNPVVAAGAAFGVDLIAVVQDDADSDTDSDTGTPAPSSADPLQGCRTPTHDLGDIERELGENWHKRTASAASHDLPDLSRLTPSKIAAFMNKDVFSAKHQSDIEKHLEEKTSVTPPITIHKEPPAKAGSDTSSKRWEADPEGSRISRKDTTSRACENATSSGSHADDVCHSYPNSGPEIQPNLSSGEEDGSLPCRFNIVSVESLPPNSLVTDQFGRVDDQQSARVRKHVGQACQETGKSSVNRTKRKRTLSKTPDGDAADEPEHSPTRRKKTKHGDQNPGKVQPTSDGSKQVFKQPIGLCVGVIPPGSLVEVSTVSTQRTSNTVDSLDGMVMKTETTDCAIRYFIHFPNMDKQLDRWVTAQDIIQVYRTEAGSTTQSASPALADANPSGQAKRRLAFEPLPEAKQHKKASAAVAAREPPGRASSVRPPPKRSHRAAIPATARAPLGDRPRDRYGRLVSTAKARVVQTTQRIKFRVISENQSRRALRFQRPVETDTKSRKTVQSNSGALKFVSFRPRRVPTAVPVVDTDRCGGSDAAAKADEQRTVPHRQTAQPVIPDSAVNRSHCAKVTCTGAHSAHHANAAGEIPKEKVTKRPVSDANAPKHVSSTGSNMTVPDGGCNKVRKRKKHKVKKEPPPGITIRPIVDSMLDSLRPGMLVYVICIVLKNGWLRVYPAMIEKAPDRNRFYVSYLGYGPSHNEWIVPELIHSIMDVGKETHKQKLKTSWLVKPGEDESPSEHEEATPVPLTLETDQESEKTSSSSGSKPPKAVEKAQGSDNSSKQGSSISRKGAGLSLRTKIVPKPRHRGSGSRKSQKLAERQHRSTRALEEHPPVLSRENPTRLSRDGSAVLPEASPPSLSQEADRVAPVTRRSTAIGGPGDVDFWTSLADIYYDSRKTRKGSKLTNSSNATPDRSPSDHATTPTVPLAGPPSMPKTGIGSAGTAASQTPAHPAMASGGSVTRKCRGRGRPRKKTVEECFPHRAARPPPSPGDLVQPSDSDVQSSETDESSVTEQRLGPPTKLAVQATSSAPQLHGAGSSSVDERHWQPAKRVAAQPTGSIAQCKQNDAGGDESNNASRPADSTLLHSASGAPSDGSGEKPSIAFKLKPKRGRPPKSSLEYNLPHIRRQQCASPVVQIARLQSHVADTKSTEFAGPADGSVVSTTNPAVPAIDRFPENHSKKSETSHPIGKEREQPTSAEVEEKQLQRRSQRASMPVAPLKDTAAPPVQPPLPSASAAQVPAASANDRLDSTFDGPEPVSTDPPIAPCTKKEIRRLKDGDVVYVVYEVKSNGTKIIYPAKILQVNRDLYYARFLIHYLGWAHRYNEWIAEEVIHSIVDRSQPNFNVKNLKEHVVPSLRLRKQLSRVRPCSVDLSANNICFFSALRRGRSSVDDKRILAMRAAVELSGQRSDQAT